MKFGVLSKRFEASYKPVPATRREEIPRKKYLTNQLLWCIV